MKIENIPEVILIAAREILDDTQHYSNKPNIDLIRRVIGKCAICQQLCSKIVLRKQDGLQVVERYCDSCFTEKKKYITKKVNKR